VPAKLEKEAEAKGEATPEEYKFDSNCITPGTEFMARLGKHLHFFLRKKMSEDPVWQHPLVIFSGLGGGGGCLRPRLVRMIACLPACMGPSCC
jgi:5'-3' exonuclease